MSLSITCSTATSLSNSIWNLSMDSLAMIVKTCKARLCYGGEDNVAAHHTFDSNKAIKQHMESIHGVHLKC